jgi:deazaflavin-dependent oxidoreductase (nitroreductase family)
VARWLGAASTLEVARRRSGTPQRLPVNVLEHPGQRYLVAVRGETEWVRNVRAAGRCEVGRRGTRHAYRAVELPVAERAEVIAAYRARWDSQVRRFWERLPGPEDHPVFRLEAERGGG